MMKAMLSWSKQKTCWTNMLSYTTILLSCCSGSTSDARKPLLTLPPKHRPLGRRLEAAFARPQLMPSSHQETEFVNQTCATHRTLFASRQWRSFWWISSLIHYLDYGHEDEIFSSELWGRAILVPMICIFSENSFIYLFIWSEQMIHEIILKIKAWVLEEISIPKSSWLWNWSIWQFLPTKVYWTITEYMWLQHD